MAEDVQATLVGLPMFANLSKTEATALSQCARVQAFEADELLFSEGDRADSFYILKSGRIKMRKFSPRGNEVTIHIAKPPNMIGCRALTSKHSAYPADAVALDPGVAVRFTRERFLKAVSDSPDVFFGLLVDMNLRLYEIYSLQSALMEPVGQRIATLLFNQALPCEVGVEDWPGHPLAEIRLTKSVIASIVGTSTETAIRILSKWKKANYIESTRGRIRIIDPESIYNVILGEDKSAPK